MIQNDITLGIILPWWMAFNIIQCTFHKDHVKVKLRKKIQRIRGPQLGFSGFRNYGMRLKRPRRNSYGMKITSNHFSSEWDQFYLSGLCTYKVTIYLLIRNIVHDNFYTNTKIIRWESLPVNGYFSSFLAFSRTSISLV